MNCETFRRLMSNERRVLTKRERRHLIGLHRSCAFCVRPVERRCVMSQEWGIFSDESADHTSDEAVESQMYSREEAEARLREMRVGFGDAPDDTSDNCYVHEVEEPEEDDDDEEEDGEDEEDEE